MKRRSSDRNHSLFFLAFLFAVSFLPCTAQAEEAQCLTLARLTEWLSAYEEAWESRDPDKAAQLFAEDARYHVTPFESPHEGPDGVRDYWASVTVGQRNINFEFQTLGVFENTGMAHWSVQLDVEPTGDSLQLDGIFVLDFDDQCQCRQLREWWHLASTDADAGESDQE